MPEFHRRYGVLGRRASRKSVEAENQSYRKPAPHAQSAVPGLRLRGFVHSGGERPRQAHRDHPGLPPRRLYGCSTRAIPPQFGPIYGSKAVSEQALAEPLIDNLPADPVLIGDRNFGVFSVTWHAHSRGQGTGAADGTTCASADGRRTERRGPQKSGVGTHARGPAQSPGPACRRAHRGTADRNAARSYERGPICSQLSPSLPEK